MLWLCTYRKFARLHQSKIIGIENESLQRALGKFCGMDCKIVMMVIKKAKNTESLCGLNTHNKNELHEEADEAHDHEAERCLCCDLVELYRQRQQLNLAQEIEILLVQHVPECSQLETGTETKSMAGSELAWLRSESKITLVFN